MRSACRLNFAVRIFEVVRFEDLDDRETAENIEVGDHGCGRICGLHPIVSGVNLVDAFTPNVLSFFQDLLFLSGGYFFADDVLKTSDVYVMSAHKVQKDTGGIVLTLPCEKF